MGTPNNGPFNYIPEEKVEEIFRTSKNDFIIIKEEFKNNKKEFIELIKEMDETIQYQAKKFADKTSSKYKDFIYRIYSNGFHEFSAIVEGNVPGSYAEYVKIVYNDGSLRLLYKNTFDNKGEYVHTHQKYPIKEKVKND